MIPLELQKARYRLAKKRPYLATALWAIVPVEQKSLGTLAVDQHWRLYYDPAVFEKWTLEELENVIYHEILHLLRRHNHRMRQFPPEVGNIAADAEINDDLREEGLKLPGKPIFPELIGEKPYRLAEEYASHLLNRDSLEKGEGLGLNAGDGGSNGENQNDGGTSKDGSNGQDGAQPSSNTSGLSPVWTSGSTGHKAPWELDAPDDGNSGLVEAEAELIRRQVAIDIKNHQKTRGNVPAHLQRLADEILKPKVDWRRVLATAVRATINHVAGMKDYSYRRPSRRQSIYKKIVMPSLYEPKVKVAVIVDTSGSMDDDLLTQALSEVQGILKSHNCDSWVLSVDAAVHSVQKVFDARQVKLVGGGGTDMRKGIAKALELRPDAIVVLTDGYTPWPEKAPQIPVVIGLLDDAEAEAPKWAKIIRIESEG